MTYEHTGCLFLCLLTCFFQFLGRSGVYNQFHWSQYLSLVEKPEVLNYTVETYLRFSEIEADIQASKQTNK